MSSTSVHCTQATDVLAKDQPQYQPLPVHYDRAQGIMTSCWELSWAERLRVLFTGRIFAMQMTFGRPLQPRLLTVDVPQDERDMIDPSAVSA